MTDNNQIPDHVMELYPQNEAVDEYNQSRIVEYPGSEARLIAMDVAIILRRLVDLMDDVMRRVCVSDQVFGGAMFIFFGDMGQLPPVRNENQFFFQNSYIQDATMYTLNEPVRQSITEQPELIAFLNSVRLYDFNDNVLVFIRDHMTDNNQIPDHVMELYPQNEAVDEYNQSRIVEYPGSEARLIAMDVVNILRLDKETELLQVLRLKVGVKVMLVSNIDVASGWVNGCTGTVVSIDEKLGIVSVRNERNEIRAIQRITRTIFRTENSRAQFPLRLVSAGTVHRVQSLTLPTGVAISLGRPFDSFGQFYVACSRATRADNLYFFQSAYNRVMIAENNVILDFIINLRQ
ncbi:hypothetical protein [Parasitella parasitica]|uniref:DNA helicase Pif1-like 2B domain-containing protein n=1 Tax=Parasitella parasitica TaxID=35722 RepID=A0A0B7NA69_9FUNG|nr:hypothetical protein [Parasitella parasitica]